MNIAYLAPEFGALSSTFVYREVAELERLGFTVQTLSTRRPSDSVMSAEAIPFAERTAYLRERGLLRSLIDVLVCAVVHPIRFVRVFTTALRDALTCEAPSNWDRPKLVWHFVQGCTVARWLADAGSQHLHAHFAHVPTSIAMYGAMLAEVPFSFTAHANDIFERGVALREKVSRAKFVACISNFNRTYLSDRGCDASKLHVVRCGIDPAVYTLREPRPFNDPRRSFWSRE
jgi:colanic acid/amylovoran biosynthesis glycosyltransferase